MWTNLNTPNLPLWDFNSTKILGIKIGNFILEDFLFVPFCTWAGYVFAWKIKNIKDYVRDKHLFHVINLSIIISLLAYAYCTGGKAAEQLQNCFLTPCLLISLFYIFYNKIKINFTHLYLCVWFFVILSNGWELLDKTVDIFKIWKYNEACELSDPRAHLPLGFHIAISVTYTFTGAFVFYSYWIIKESIKKVENK